MNEHEILKKLEESAKTVSIPKALEPDQIKRHLNSRQQKQKRWYKPAVVAACLCLCFVGGSAAYYSHNRNYQDDINQNSQNQDISNQNDRDLEQYAKGSERQQSDHEDSSQTEDMTMPGESLKNVQEAPKRKIGKMYTLASDYGDVYDVLLKSNYVLERESHYTENRKEDDAMVKFLQMDESQPGAISEAASDSQSNVDYSSTNLQVEGVDESDIVKTDGKYIYVVQDEQVQILDIQNKVPQAAAKIDLNLEEELAQIHEMYVADHLLTIIVQAERTSMQEKEEEKAEGEDKDSAYERSVEDAEDDNGVTKMETACDAYIMDTAVVTKILSYDITNPEKPLLQDTATQDGWYKTSRKINSHLYLFTSQSLYPDVELSRKRAMKDGNKSLWLPSVNDSVIRADCIYLPKQGNEGLLMSSIDLADHNKVLDTKLLINDHAELYVSQTAVYLYYTDYNNGAERTRIARFGLDTDGMIRAKAAAALKGSITDTFAIHERDGYLQVLTSLSSSEPWENRVYVLDENMKVTGKLAGIAEGESIYSARFVGTVGYFVTYRNIDPLFTVDFSDPKQPKVIGELKVTGFSEYLHFWSDKLLLGIGYETDPDDGRRVGVKLSMFDISDPSKVTEKAKIVLDADEAAAMYDYKCVLVDRQKNIIALTTKEYDQGQLDYRVFSFQNGKFSSRLQRTLNKKYAYWNDGYSWRSLYVGDILYLVNSRKAFAFDIKNEYKEIAKVKYNK